MKIKVKYEVDVTIEEHINLAVYAECLGFGRGDKAIQQLLVLMGRAALGLSKQYAKERQLDKERNK